MLLRTKIGFCLLVIILQISISCSNHELGNRVLVQPIYEAIDAGSPFGACIFIGNKQGGYTTYEEVLIHSEIISCYQKDNLVYLKQKFDLDGFKFLIKQELEYKNLDWSYIPEEILNLLKKDSENKGPTDFLDNSNNIKYRIKNGLYNYYVLNTQDYSVKSFFKESEFMDYLNKNQHTYFFKEL